MELATTLQAQRVETQVRTVGINPNYWYPVAWSNQLKPGQLQAVQVWQQPLVIYRDDQSTLHALEDACPHKGVALHKGKVEGSHLICPYHGWQFDGDGHCVGIPYLPAGQKLPCAQARAYPVQERYGLIWVFPGDRAQAENCPLPTVPEFDDPSCFLVRVPGHFKAHFSICNENTMDVFHGYLHRELQGWFNPMLLNLKQTADAVIAEYQVSYQGGIAQFLGLSQGGSTTKTVRIQYQYPHYHSVLENVSSLYLMRLPVSPLETRSFSLLFLKLPLPRPLLSFTKILGLEKLILNGIFMRFLRQDVEMVESEQQSYLTDPQRQYVEINPAILALQRVIVGQYVKFMQQSI